jgi:PAS domain S-box-containing protein
MTDMLQKIIPQKVPLRFVLIVPFVAIIILAVSLIGYSAFINGHKTVNAAARQIRREISARIEDHLRVFLETPRQINEFNAVSLQQGWSDKKNKKALQAYFLEQVKNHNTISSIYFGNTEGGIIGSGREGVTETFYVYATEDLKSGAFDKYAIAQSGEAGKLLTSIPKFDARTRPWYTGAQQKKAFGWNNIYILFTGQDMAISASSPVYDTQHNLLGVVSVDIFLSQVGDFLQSLKISKSGQSFIMESTGLLVATSTGEKPFIEKDGKDERLDARSSQSPLVKYSADFLYERFHGNYDINQEQQLEFAVDGKRYFLTVSPFHDAYGIDWIIVTIIPEADFTAGVTATNQSTILITLLALGVSIGVSVFISQKIASRVSYLNESARAFTQGKGEGPEVFNSRISEIDELTTSFIEMQQQLRQTLHDLNEEADERKAAAQTLRESEQRYKMVSELASDYIYKISIAADGKISLDFVTDKFYSTTGRNMEEARTLESWSKIFHPNDIEKVMAFLQSLIVTHQPGQIDCRTYIANGQMRWVEIIARPEWDAKENRVTAIVGAVKDITERKLAEEKILESEEQLKAVIEGSQLGYSDWNIKTGKIWRNERWADMLGYTLEEIGKSYQQWEHLLHPDDLARAQRSLQDHLDGKTPIHRDEYRLRAKDGSYRWILDQGTIIEYDAQGNPVRMTATHTDITERKRIEEALAESEKQFRSVLETTPLLGVMLDVEGRITLCNDFLLNLTGWKREEVLGKAWFDIFLPPEVRDEIKDGIFSQGIRDGAIPSHYANEIITRQNERRLIQWNNTILRDQKGSVTGVASIGEDITARKQAEKALYESESRFRLLAENSTDMISRHDIQGVYLYASPACRTLLGYEPEELIGHSAFEFIHPDDIPTVDQSRSNIINEPVVSTTVFRVRCKNGQYIWLETSSHTIVDKETGMAVEIHAASRDIAARKQAEEALQESEERYRTVVSSAPVVTFITDEKGIFTLSEGKGLAKLGLQPGQVVGLSAFDVYRDYPLIVQSMKKALAGESLRNEVEVQGVAFDVTYTPIFDEQGKVAKVIGVSSDITERKQAEDEIRNLNAELEQRVRERTAQLEITNKELEAFAYSVSHDLRAPLRGIDGWSQALLEDYQDKLDEQGRQYINRVRSETQRMGHLIEDMLQLSRLTRAEMRTEKVDLSALARAVIERLKMEEPNREVKFDIQENLVARGDAHLLESVLSNLLGNAFKFTSKCADARIELGQVKMEGQPVFFVRDNGAGFDMDYSQKLFGAFQRMHKTTEYPGTGIGLATVQRVIHRHGGRVWAEAKVNEGATFYFIIPE